MRSYEDLDARNGMNRAPRSSRDLTARSFENQLMGRASIFFLIVHITWKDKLSRSSQLGMRLIFSINLSLNRLYLIYMLGCIYFYLEFEICKLNFF